MLCQVTTWVKKLPSGRVIEAKMKCPICRKHISEFLNDARNVETVQSLLFTGSDEDSRIRLSASKIGIAQTEREQKIVT
jgi:TusA-related sulfurtransferase